MLRLVCTRRAPPRGVHPLSVPGVPPSAQACTRTIFEASEAALRTWFLAVHVPTASETNLSARDGQSDEEVEVDGQASVFEYMYRDGGNFKTHGELLLTGYSPEAEQVIRGCLEWDNLSPRLINEGLVA